MTVTARPKKRIRSTSLPASAQPLAPTADYNYALVALVERLESIRSQAVALRDEHKRCASEIEDKIATREAAANAAAKVNNVRKNDAAELITIAAEHPVSTPTLLASPSLPPIKLLTEQDSPEKLIREQSIVIRAQAITRKNAELARERLPKQPEAQTRKTWHDYLLDETVWMATDFREERKWKIQVAKKLAKAVMQYHAQKATREARAKIELHQRTVKLANSVARDVRKFWSQIRQIVDFKYSRIERARRMEESRSQLNKFMERTEAYSNEIASRFQPTGQQSLSPSRPHHDVQVKQVTFAEVAVKVNVHDPGHGRSLPCSSECQDEQTNAVPVPSMVDVTAEDKMHNDTSEPNAGSADHVSLDACGKVKTDVVTGKQLAEPANLVSLAPMSVEHKSKGLLPDGTALDLVAAKKAPALGGHDKPGGSPLTVKEVGTTAYISSSHSKGRVASERLSSVQSGTHCNDKADGNEDERGCDSQAGSCAVKIKSVATVGSDHRVVDRMSDAPMDTSIRMPVDLLRGDLRDYQLSGMEWLINLYRSDSNGILADEMGLGKTIQTISLLAWLAVEQEVWGPHLIVVPTSVIINWEVEFKKWLPGFKVLTYFGSMKERKLKRKGWTDPDMFHVCITSYTLAVQDVHILRRKKWEYLILDEAHNIKNFKSQRWQTLLTFSARRRLLLTGTPLQNSIMELWSLMHFLMPNLFESHSEFKDWFSNPLQDQMDPTSENATERNRVVNQLHKVLRPFLLRRLKADVEKGLPPKHEHIVKCRLSKRQRQLYEDFMARSDVVENLHSGDFFKVMNVLMQLRKVCNHPDLFEGRPILSPFAMPSIVLPIPGCVAKVFDGRRANSVNLDLLGLDMCTKELTWPGRWNSFQAEQISIELVARELLLKRWQADLDIADRDESTISEASLRARNRALKYQRESLFHLAVVSAHRIRERGLIGEDVRAVCTMTPTSLAQSLQLNRGSHDSFLPSSGHGLVQTLEEVGEKARVACERFVCCVTKASASVAKMMYKGVEMRDAASMDGVAELNEVSSTYRSLFRSFDVRSQVTIPDKRLLQWDCGKLQMLDGLLRMLRARNSRVLIFTQMAKVLDVLESFLNLHTYRYLRLDGTTKTDDRQKVVQRFNSDKRIFCMILTTRAGGVGLNLTGADSVVFYDTDYNPAIDNQAQDRAHRIGQTKPVNIYRLVSQDTVEENILRRANEKRSLENQIISDAGFTTDAIRKLGPAAGGSALENRRDSKTVPSTEGAREEGIRIRNGISDQSGISRGGTNSGDVALVNGTLSIESAGGPFRGLFASGEEHPVTTLGREGSSNHEKLAEEYQEMSDKILASDDRERVAMFSAEQERQSLEAEFRDDEDTTMSSATAAAQKKPDNDDLAVEKALTPIQKYALSLLEHWHDDEPGDGGESDVDDSPDLRAGRSPAHSSTDNLKTERVTDEAKELDITDVLDGNDQGEEDLEEEELFYELDMTEEGRMNYLKALTDADVDIKLYLPLRDGGPEELKVSTVVCGTAAVGLECAEDAAFFPHAYNRMSRTPYMTRRQKEKSLANLRKRIAEEDARRRRDIEREIQRAAAAQLEHHVAPSATDRIGNTSTRGMNAQASTDLITPIGGDGNSKMNDKMKLGSSTPRMQQQGGTSGLAGSSNGITSAVLAGFLANGGDRVKENGTLDLAKSMSVGERAKLQKQKSDGGGRGNGPITKKLRLEQANRARGSSSSGPGLSSDLAFSTGLFKKVIKKPSKKCPLTAVKVANATGPTAVVGSSLGENSRWTKEEDEELLAVSEKFNHNMLLVSAVMASNPKVGIGARPRRRMDHCIQRVIKCYGKDKTGRATPLSNDTDAAVFKAHWNGMVTATRSEEYGAGRFTLPPPSEEYHATQQKAILEASSKKPSILSSNIIPPTLAAVSKGIKVSEHYQRGYKAWETTPSALRKKKYPYISPPRDELRIDSSGWHLKGGQYGSGVQVSGTGVVGDSTVSLGSGSAAVARTVQRSGLAEPDSSGVSGTRPVAVCIGTMPVVSGGVGKGSHGSKLVSGSKAELGSAGNGINLSSKGSLHQVVVTKKIPNTGGPGGVGLGLNGTLGKGRVVVPIGVGKMAVKGNGLGQKKNDGKRMSSAMKNALGNALVGGANGVGGNVKNGPSGGGRGGGVVSRGKANVSNGRGSGLKNRAHSGVGTVIIGSGLNNLSNVRDERIVGATKAAVGSNRVVNKSAPKHGVRNGVGNSSSVVHALTPALSSGSAVGRGSAPAPVLTTASAVGRTPIAPPGATATAVGRGASSVPIAAVTPASVPVIVRPAAPAAVRPTAPVAARLAAPVAGRPAAPVTVRPVTPVGVRPAAPVAARAPTSVAVRTSASVAARAPPAPVVASMGIPVPVAARAPLAARTPAGRGAVVARPSIYGRATAVGRAPVIGRGTAVTRAPAAARTPVVSRAPVANRASVVNRAPVVNQVPVVSSILGVGASAARNVGSVSAGASVVPGVVAGAVGGHSGGSVVKNGNVNGGESLGVGNLGGVVVTASNTNGAVENGNAVGTVGVEVGSNVIVRPVGVGSSGDTSGMNDASGGGSGGGSKNEGGGRGKIGKQSGELKRETKG